MELEIDLRSFHDIHERTDIMKFNECYNCIMKYITQLLKYNENYHENYRGHAISLKID